MQAEETVSEVLMKTERVDVSSLNPDPANVRTHSTRNIQAIKSSLARFGQQKPIVIDGNGVVVAGNGTLEAAIELGWDRIDTVRTKLCGADAIAFGIADNRTAELAEWDDDALAQLVGALPDELREVTGFDAEELESMLGGVGVDPVEVEAPPPPDEPTTNRGDLWLLGAYWECDDCSKRYEYQEGVDMKECPCG